MLCTILENRNAYFQPPESIKMNYPAIVYKLANIKPLYANDNFYKQITCYELTVIDKDPDSKIRDKISCLPFCKFDRHFTYGNLNHYVFTLYY